MRTMFITIVWFALSTTLHAQSMVGIPLPRIEGESLTGQKLILPDAFKGKQALLFITFTKTAGESGRKLLARDDIKKLNVYPVAFLESVPRIFRGLIRMGMKSSVPDSIKPQFLVVVQDEAAWKARLGIKNLDQPCAVLVASDGKVKWVECAAASQLADDLGKALRIE